MFTPKRLALGISILLLLIVPTLHAQQNFGYLTPITFPTKKMAPTASTVGRQKEIQVRLGLGLAAYATVYNLEYNLNGIKITETDSSGAVTRHLNLDLRYEFTPRLNAGIDMKFGSYLYDPNDDDNVGKSNTYTVLGIAGEFTIVNKPNFRWYAGLGWNTAVLVMRDEDPSINFKEEATFAGGGFKMNTGILGFIKSSPFGFNFNLGYDKHNFNLQSYTQNGSSQDLTNIEGKLEATGIDLTIGLIFRIRH